MPRMLERDEKDDPVVCLLNWCHWEAVVDAVTDKRFREILRKSDIEKLKRRRDADLKKLYIHNPPGTRDESSYRYAETKWNQLALLTAELFGDGSANPCSEYLISKTDQKTPDSNQTPLASNKKGTEAPKHTYKGASHTARKLVDYVTKRLEGRKPTKLGKRAPWEYWCLNHSLPLDLAVAKIKLGATVEPLGCSPQEIREAFKYCHYFLQSDYSLITSWEPSGTVDIDNRWSFECSSIVATAFLSAMSTLDLYGGEPVRDGEKNISMIIPPLHNL